MSFEKKIKLSISNRFWRFLGAGYFSDSVLEKSGKIIDFNRYKTLIKSAKKLFPMAHNDNDHSMIHLTSKEIAPLWYKFRDIEPKQNAALHMMYCEMIQEAMCHDQTDEAFRLLVEGIQWYDSVNEA